jgi:hypothetical protein
MIGTLLSMQGDKHCGQVVHLLAMLLTPYGVTASVGTFELMEQQLALCVLRQLTNLEINMGIAFNVVLVHTQTVGLIIVRIVRRAIHAIVAWQHNVKQAHFRLVVLFRARLVQLVRPVCIATMEWCTVVRRVIRVMAVWLLSALQALIPLEVRGLVQRVLTDWLRRVQQVVRLVLVVHIAMVEQRILVHRRFTALEVYFTLAPEAHIRMAERVTVPLISRLLHQRLCLV